MRTLQFFLASHGHRLLVTLWVGETGGALGHNAVSSCILVLQHTPSQSTGEGDRGKHRDARGGATKLLFWSTFACVFDSSGTEGYHPAINDPLVIGTRSVPWKLPSRTVYSQLTQLFPDHTDFCS